MKTIVRIALIVMLPLFGMAQNGVRFTDKFGPFHDTYEVENDFANRKVVSYPFIREADVMWSKVTWEIIDLREKSNLALYYPTDTLHKRKSLIHALLDGIEKNQFTAFKTTIRSNEFEFDPANIFLSVEDIKKIGQTESIESVEVSPGVFEDRVITTNWRTAEIKQILVKKIWYISRKESRLRNEVVGICPMREYVANGTLRKERMFWIYYPDARSYLATVPVYNPGNNRPLYTFDDIFVYGYYRSYFVQEENVYNDRLITDYVIGREAQLESERIKREIFDYEQDLWEN